jgi:UDP-N-acetylmuramoylalanine-D-glutamate ligase
MSSARKVVCVGLGKTGTTSLARFLSQLGLKHYSNFNDAILTEGASTTPNSTAITLPE